MSDEVEDSYKVTQHESRRPPLIFQGVLYLHDSCGRPIRDRRVAIIQKLAKIVNSAITKKGFWQNAR